MEKSWKETQRILEEEKNKHVGDEINLNLYSVLSKILLRDSQLYKK